MFNYTIPTPTASAAGSEPHSDRFVLITLSAFGVGIAIVVVISLVYLRRRFACLKQKYIQQEATTHKSLNVLKKELKIIEEGTVEDTQAPPPYSEVDETIIPSGAVKPLLDRDLTTTQTRDGETHLRKVIGGEQSEEPEPVATVETPRITIIMNKEGEIVERIETPSSHVGSADSSKQEHRLCSTTSAIERQVY